MKLLNEEKMEKEGEAFWAEAIAADVVLMALGKNRLMSDLDRIETDMSANDETYHKFWDDAAYALAWINDIVQNPEKYKDPSYECFRTLRDLIWMIIY